MFDSWLPRTAMRVLIIITLAPLMLLAVSSPRVTPSIAGPSETTSNIGIPAIAFEHDGGVLVVRGLYKPDRQVAQGGRSPRDLSYTLTVKRTGEGGTSETRQSGTFSVASASNDTLATVGMRVSSDVRVSGELTISDDASVLETVEETWTDS